MGDINQSRHSIVLRIALCQASGFGSLLGVVANMQLILVR